MYFTPSNNNNSAHLGLLASLRTRILMHHKGKGFPSCLFAKRIHLNVTQGLVFFSYHCGITVIHHSIRASIKYTLLLNIITAAKSSIQKTGNARIQAWLPACIHYDTNFVIRSAFECSEFFMLRTVHNWGTLNAPRGCPRVSIAHKQVQELTRPCWACVNVHHGPLLEEPRQIRHQNIKRINQNKEHIVENHLRKPSFKQLPQHHIRSCVIWWGTEPARGLPAMKHPRVTLQGWPQCCLAHDKSHKTLKNSEHQNFRGLNGWGWRSLI